MLVSHVERCGHTYVRYITAQLHTVLHSVTTECHFDICKNADVCMSDVHPLLTEPSAIEL